MTLRLLGDAISLVRQLLFPKPYVPVPRRPTSEELMERQIDALEWELWEAVQS